MLRVLLCRVSSPLSVPGKRRLACALLVVITCIGLPALAVKPGSTGARSTATVTISLVVPPTVRVKHFNNSGREDSGALTPDSSGYLCVNTRDTRTLSFYVLSENTTKTGNPPVARWSATTRHSTGQKEDSSCAVAVPLDLSRIDKPASDTLTVIVSPE